MQSSADIQPDWLFLDGIDFLQAVEKVGDCLELLGLLGGDPDAEFLLKTQKEFHRIQGIRPEILDKASLERDFLDGNVELLSDDGLDFGKEFSEKRAGSIKVFVHQ